MRPARSAASATIARTSEARVTSASIANARSPRPVAAARDFSRSRFAAGRVRLVYSFASAVREGGPKGCGEIRMNLSNELIAIAIVGVGLAGFVWNLSRDVRRVEVELRERMARVEGLLEGLRDSVTGRGKEAAR